MALTITRVTGDVQDVRGRYKSVRATFDDTSYTSGGVAITDTHAKSLGLRKIVGIDFEGVSDLNNIWHFDASVPEVRVYETGAALSGVLAEKGAAEDAGAVLAVVYGY